MSRDEAAAVREELDDKSNQLEQLQQNVADISRQNETKDAEVCITGLSVCAKIRVSNKVGAVTFVFCTVVSTMLRYAGVCL